MQAYSQDLRDRVLRAVERGERPTDIAERFEVSRLWVYQVANRFKTTGQRSSLQVGGHRLSKIAHLESTIRDWLKAEPDQTLLELSERLSKQGIELKVPALWHQLNKWNLSFKKNPARQRARARGRAAGS